MPRIDPRTGCTVATTMEVFSMIAEREGSTTEDVIDQYLTETAEDERRSHQDLVDHALERISTLQREMRCRWKVTNVKEVIASRFRESFSGCKWALFLHADCTDTRSRYVVAQLQSWNDTWSEPGDWDGYVSGSRDRERAEKIWEELT